MKFGRYNPQTNVTLNCEGIVDTLNNDVIGHVTTRHFRQFTGMGLFETPLKGFNWSTSNLVSEISRPSRCQIAKLLSFCGTRSPW